MVSKNKNWFRRSAKILILLFLFFVVMIAATFFVDQKIGPGEKTKAAGTIKYARTAGGNWNADATWSTTSGGAADTTVPTATDDVILDSNSGNVVINAAAACRSLNMTSGTGNYAGVLNHDASRTLTIGDATAGTGNVALKFVGTGTYTIDSGDSAAIVFLSSSATQQDIDFNGFNTANVTFGSSTVGGNYRLTANWGTSAIYAWQQMNLIRGTFDTNGYACNWGRVDTSNAYPRTLTLGNSTINIWVTASQNSAHWVMSTVTNLNFNANTSIIIFNGARSGQDVLAGGGKTFYEVRFLGTGGNVTVSGANSFTNLTRTGTATQGDNFVLTANQIVTGTLTMSGNSTINRVLIQSDTIGTSRTITVTGATIATNNIDLQDINFADNKDGATDLTNGGVNSVGNCGGNTRTLGTNGSLTFTPVTTQTFASTSGSWSDVAKWTSRVPLPQDLARFQAMSAGQTITVDMPRLPNTDFSSATNIPAVNLTTTGLTYSIYGSWNLTGVGAFSCTKDFKPSARSNFSITSAGKSWACYVMTYNYGATLTFNDALNITGGYLNINVGMVSSNYAVTAQGILSVGATAVNFGAGTWTCTSGNLQLIGTGGVTGTPNIAMADTSSTARTFQTSASVVINNIIIAPGSGVLTFSGAFTFANMTMSGAGAKTVKFTKATTYTMTGTSFLGGTTGNLITLDTNDGTGVFTLTKASGIVVADFDNISRSTVTGGAVWYMTANSVNTTGNTGWTASGSGNIRTASPTGGNWSAVSAWNEGIVPTSTEDVFFVSGSGNVTTDGNVTCKSLTQSGYTNILSHSSYTLTVGGNVTLLPNKYVVNLGSAQLSITSTSTLTTGGNGMGTVVVNIASGTLTLGDNLTGLSSQIAGISITRGGLNLNGKTVSGNSSTNRLLVKSNTIGTAQTVNVNGATFANADFQDIAFDNGGSNLDLSAITGLSGDCGGNSMSGGGTLIFTPSTTQTFASTGGSWSDVAKWTSRVPLPQDLARFQAMSAGQTITVDMPRLPDTDFSGTTNTPTVVLTTPFDYFWYGSINLTGVGTWTSTRYNNLVSHTNVTLTSAGKIFTTLGLRFYAVGAKVTLLDALTSGTSTWIRLFNGTLETNYNVTTGQYTGYAGSTTNMGSGIWTLSDNAAAWLMQGSLSCGTSTIALTYTGASATTFSGGTNTYNNIVLTPGASALTFSGGFTFANMTMASAGTKTIKFNKNTIYTMTGTNFLNGTAGNLVTIDSDDGATQFTLTKASGIVIANYDNISRSNITGTGKWYMANTTVSGSGNTGWSTDALAPTNPDTIATNVDGTNIINGTWIALAGNINFQFSGATDPDSGVVGYYTYFGTDPAADPTNYQAHVGAIGDTQVYSTSITTADDGKHFYFRIKTQDAVGNISTAGALFDFGYDITAPNRPTFIAASPAGYTTVNSFVLTWPAATDPNGPGGGASGVKNYEYKRATDADWTATADANERTVANVLAYQEGSNIFYVRTIDNALNISSYQQVTYYWSNSAPAKPTNLAVNPPVYDINEFTISWDKPAVPVGNPPVVGYYYSINAYPTVANVTYVASQADNVSIGNSPFATLQGENTVYVLTVNSAGNLSYEPAYVASATFICQTVAPPIPTEVSLVDSSNRAYSTWSLTLAWTAGSGQDPATFSHYSIERATNGVDFSALSTSEGSAFIDVSGLNDTTTYSYRVKAVDSAGKESAPSSIVSKKPVGNYLTPPTIVSTPAVSEIKATGSKVSWTTDRASSSIVRYGKNNDGTFEVSTGQFDAVTSHTVTLLGLSPSTVYYYQVQSLDEYRDYSPDSAYSTTYSFATATAPAISDTKVSNITLSTADISFETTTVSTSTIYYGETAEYGKQIDDISGAQATKHNVKLTELSAGTTYHFRIRGQDIEGNPLLSDDYQFDTLPLPKITNLKIEAIAGKPQSAFKASWTTNVPTTTVLKFKTGKADYQESAKSKSETGHIVEVYDLLDNSEYLIVVSGRDIIGNLVESSVARFSTPEDTRSPIISDIRIETSNVGSGNTSRSQVAVSWLTDEPATSQVEFETGAAGAYSNKTQEDMEMVVEHTVIVSDLDSSELYHLKVVSKDTAGNLAESGNQVFITGEAKKSVWELIMSVLNSIFGFIKIGQ